MKTIKKTEAEQIKEIKREATVKVKNLVLAIVWSITIIAAIIGGWTLKCMSDTRFEVTVQRAVEARTSVLVEQLKTDK